MNKSHEENPREQHYAALARKLKPKYCLDQFMAVLLLFLTSPIFLIFAMAILIEGRWKKIRVPVFYTETRITAGKPFRIIKFCTVTQEGLAWIREDPDHRSITGCQYRSFAGKMILKFYLDELPQLINILKGEMSFVGPRPHIISMHEGEIKAGWLYRNYLKAGLLGIPQASKRDPRFQSVLQKMAQRQISDIDSLNTLDGLYVKKCLDYGIVRIIILDIAIIAKCLLVVFQGEDKHNLEKIPSE